MSEKKKKLAIFLTAVMVFLTSVTSFAAESILSEAENDIQAEVAEENSANDAAPLSAEEEGDTIGEDALLLAASDEKTDYSKENGAEQYTLTVPATLTPGGAAGDVVLEGTWPSDETVTVTADDTVELTNSINPGDKKTLSVYFDGISLGGDNTQSVSTTEPVSVEAISNALFGDWEGSFSYQVGFAN